MSKFAFIFKYHMLRNFSQTTSMALLFNFITLGNLLLFELFQKIEGQTHSTYIVSQNDTVVNKY